MSGTPQTSATILPFIRPPRPGNRLSMRDRITAHEWHQAATAAGYARIAFENAADDDAPELGDFLLIYTSDTQWASWGIGCSDGGFIVWRPADGATRSWHRTLSQALGAVPMDVPQ